ncbi:hypothetical protein RR46_03464 [Papilio xuthus]|uniref:Uncharacterized protein n=1 Tax=Papilio xuthus TaxID=66420 RepID=A0A194Q9U3_PAPXU|nr:hypothetical protein RR46_03464 [Papilio xuthus]
MAAATLAAVRAKPQPVPLEAALNHTVCPIEVEVDDNPERVPRRIKLIKCKSDPKEWCKQQDIPKNECCEHNHHAHRMDCVQIEDVVLVHFPANATTSTMHVAVGCACMVKQIQKAPSASTGP